MATDATTGLMGSLPPQPQPGLNWSPWCHCESSFSLLLVPARAGIFAVGEEVLVPGESAATAGKRLLAVLQFGQAQDLSRALSRLFTPASPIYERLASGRCFVRYSVIEDSARREAACAALQDWLAASAEAAAPQSSSPAAPDRELKRAEAPPPPLPAGF